MGAEPDPTPAGYSDPGGRNGGPSRYKFLATPNFSREAMALCCLFFGDEAQLDPDDNRPMINRGRSDVPLAEPNLLRPARRARMPE